MPERLTKMFTMCIRFSIDVIGVTAVFFFAITNVEMNIVLSIFLNKKWTFS